MKKVMIFGTFDILHPGHLNLFSQARQFGDYLVVVVAHDETVKNIKGKYPVNNQFARIKKITRLKEVNEVIAAPSGSEHFKVIEKIGPAVVCLGYDQQSFVLELRQWLKEKQKNVVLRRARPYQPDIYKSSKLIKQLVAK